MSPGRGDPSLGCGLCHSPHRARAQANATLGATVTLGCPAAGVPLGRLLAERWYFWGDTAGDAVTVCSQNRGHPRCHPPYGDRAALVSPPGTPETPGPPETPRGLLLRGLRDGDAGTYSCLLLGDDDCACGEVTLRLGEVTLRGGERGDPHPGVRARGAAGAPHPRVGAQGTWQPLMWVPLSPPCHRCPLQPSLLLGRPPRQLRPPPPPPPAAAVTQGTRLRVTVHACGTRGLTPTLGELSVSPVSLSSLSSVSPVPLSPPLLALSLVSSSSLMSPVPLSLLPLLSLLSPVSLCLQYP